MSPAWAEITDCAEARMQSSVKVYTRMLRRSMPTSFPYCMLFGSRRPAGFRIARTVCTVYDELQKVPAIPHALNASYTLETNSPDANPRRSADFALC